jgi:hypothetical protein
MERIIKIFGTLSLGIMNYDPAQRTAERTRLIVAADQASVNSSDNQVPMRIAPPRKSVAWTHLRIG